MSGQTDNNNVLEHNKQLVSQFIELTWNQGRFNLAKNLVCRDFKYHASMVNLTLEYDQAAAIIANVRDAMQDFEVSVEEIVAEGDKVVTQSSFCGTLTKPMFGFQPGANLVTFSAVSFWQIRKGHVRSLSTLLDTAEMMRQMEHEGNDFKIDVAAVMA